MTTQYVNEAEECDTVALIADGRLIALGRPDDLRREALRRRRHRDRDGRAFDRAAARRPADGPRASTSAGRASSGSRSTTRPPRCPTSSRPSPAARRRGRRRRSEVRPSFDEVFADPRRARRARARRGRPERPTRRGPPDATRSSRSIVRADGVRRQGDHRDRCADRARIVSLILGPFLIMAIFGARLQRLQAAARDGHRGPAGQRPADRRRRPTRSSPAAGSRSSRSTPDRAAAEARLRADDGRRGRRSPRTTPRQQFRAGEQSVDRGPGRRRRPGRPRTTRASSRRACRRADQPRDHRARGRRRARATPSRPGEPEAGGHPARGHRRADARRDRQRRAVDAGRHLVLRARPSSR